VRVPTSSLPDHSPCNQTVWRFLSFSKRGVAKERGNGSRIIIDHPGRLAGSIASLLLFASPPRATLHALTTTLLLSHIYCIDRQVSTFVLDHILNPPNLLHPSHVSRSIVTGLYKHLGSYIDSQPDASTPSCLTYSSLWIIIVERQLFQCFVHG
jgi:hypothetical protein